MKKKIRIAFFSDMLIRNYDGCMRTIFNIIDRQPENIEFQFYTGEHTLGNDKKKLHIPSMAIPFNDAYRFAIPSLKKRKLTKSLDEFKPDAIHIASPSQLGNFAIKYAKSKNIPIISIYHTHYIAYVDYYLSEFKALIPFAKKLIKSNLKKFYNRCDLVLVPTSNIIQELNTIGVKRDKMRLWQRGIDKSIFNPRLKDSNYIRSIVKNKKPNLLFASRLVWEKNLKTLINIYKKNEASGSPYNFVIAGDGIAKSDLEVEMPSAIFLGKVNQTILAKLYASSDIFIFPSISETFGNVVTEAMSCGLPCIVGNGGGPASFIEHNKNGYLINKTDVEEFWSTINLLLSNHEIHNRISKNGLKFTQHMDWTKLVHEYYDLIETLIKNSKLDNKLAA